MNDKKLYAHRDIEGQKQFYLDHISHMTSEGLHSKSDIAAELAHRDILIKKLLDTLHYTRNTYSSYFSTALLVDIEKIIEKAEDAL